jgi:hypothetical protein
MHCPYCSSELASVAEIPENDWYCSGPISLYCTNEDCTFHETDCCLLFHSAFDKKKGPGDSWSISFIK